MYSFNNNASIGDEFSTMGSELAQAMATAVDVDPYAIGQNLGGLGDAAAMSDADDSVMAGDVFGAVPIFKPAMIRG